MSAPKGPASRKRKAELSAAATGRKAKKSKSVKNQIRSLQRLLKAELPAKARAKNQQKVKELEDVFLGNKQQERERRLAVKYHKVRFFERVKLERQLKQLSAQKLQLTDTSQQEAADQRLKQLQDDLQYVKFFPKGQKYISILKQAQTPEDQTRLDQQRLILRQQARQRQSDEAMLAEADEGRSIPSATAVQPHTAQDDADSSSPFDDLFGAEGLGNSKRKQQGATASASPGIPRAGPDASPASALQVSNRQPATAKRKAQQSAGTKLDSVRASLAIHNVIALTRLFEQLVPSDHTAISNMPDTDMC
ncbi:hypothetical protein WJX73_008394 [Symbiochloris irregularis]|uniref:rRNA-processing protein EFG1 n=1 Tax=Symbiochloris irregularis TaxID=706552 RepID=A0AAW1NZV4_9CHLO